MEVTKVMRHVTLITPTGAVHTAVLQFNMYPLSKRDTMYQIFNMNYALSSWAVELGIITNGTMMHFNHTGPYGVLRTVKLGLPYNDEQEYDDATECEHAATIIIGDVA